MRESVLILLLCWITTSNAKWHDVGEVCFGSNHCEFGRFKIPAGGKFQAITMTHTKGLIMCTDPKAAKGYGANWGCDKNEKHLGTVVTNDDNAIVFPTTYQNTGRTYFESSGLTVNSATLGFSNMINPIRTTAGEEYKIWFLEDLNGKSHRKNEGKACANVSVYIKPIMQ